MATQKKLSNVEFITGIESVSRKFARRIDTAANKYVAKGEFVSGSAPSVDSTVVPGQAFFGNVSRVVQVFGIGNVRKNTFFVRKPFAAKAATQSQIAVRERMIAAKAWVDAAMESLEAISDNQAIFLQCKNDFTKSVWGVKTIGYQTMRGWMMACAIAKLTTGETLPTNHKLVLDA